MERITSLQNERVKLARALQTRPRSRRKERKIVLEGARLIRDAVERDHQPEFVLYEPHSVNHALVAFLNDRHIMAVPVSAEVMRHVSDTENPQGIVGVFLMPFPPLPKAPRRVLILDAVREPGNVGAILRTAAAGGVEAVILSPDCADPYNPKALRAGMGAHFRIPVIETSWAEIAAYCEPLHVYLADSHGETRYDAVDWTAAWALIIGSEARGAGSQSNSLAELRIAIPMAAETESLNAAVAAGIILFEARRQRGHTTP